MTTYPVLSQRDPQWSRQPVGYSTETIGNVGCLFMCSLMMVCRDQTFKPEYVPAHMACLKDHGNYTPAGGAYLQSYNVAICEPSAWGTVKLLDVSPVYNLVDFPTDKMTVLANHLRSGNPAFLEVDPTPGTLGIGDGVTHFVLAVGINAAGIPIINDPWYGDQVPLCPRYGSYPAYAIYRSVLYDIGAQAPPPVVVPPAQTRTRLGVNIIGGNAAVIQQWIDAGCKRIHITFNPDAAVQLKRAHPEIEVSHRANFYEGHLPSVQEFRDKHGYCLTEKGMKVFGVNEGNQIGSGGDNGLVIKDIADRAQWDARMWQLCKDNGSTFVGAGFGMGLPNIVVKEMRDAMRKYYAPLFNAGMLFNQHMYSGNDHSGIDIKKRMFSNVTNLVTWDGISVPVRQTWWLEERPRFYVAFCGFDGSKSAFECDETGVDNPGPFNDFGFTEAEKAAWGAEWCRRNSEPMPDGGPYRVNSGCLFADGDYDRWGAFANSIKPATIWRGVY